MHRIAILLSALLALFAVAPGAQADPYSPQVPTTCTIEVTAGNPGQRVVVNVSVTANGADQPTGTVEVSISRGQSASSAWSTTQRYEGAPLRIVGPRLGAGEHVARVNFAPDGDLYGSCSDTTRFRVGAGGEVGGVSETPGNGGGGGGDVSGDLGGAGFLPNTGGPHLILLLLGLGMVAVGGGAVARSRQLA